MRMPSSVPCDRIPEAPHPRALYRLATRTDLGRSERARIAEDELAALRYLIHAGRSTGDRSPLDLPRRSQALLHALNDLLTRPDRHRLPALDLLNLYVHYGSDAVTAEALINRRTTPHPVLASALRRDGAEALGMTPIRRCASRPNTLPAACAPLAVQRQWSTTLLGRGLPPCEDAADQAERVYASFEEWSRNDAMRAGPDRDAWQACFHRLGARFAGRGDPRFGALPIPRYWQRDRFRASQTRFWFLDTFEWALLDNTPHEQIPHRPPNGRAFTCFCQRWRPVKIEPAPAAFSIRPAR